MKRPRVSLLLLLIGLIVHYGWQQFPPALAAEAWNLGGSLGRLVLLTFVVVAYWSPLVAAVGAWWAFEEAQVFVCGVAWMVKPWPVEQGAERCSSWLGIPMGILGLLVVMVLVYVIRQQGQEHG